MGRINGRELDFMSVCIFAGDCFSCKEEKDFENIACFILGSISNGSHGFGSIRCESANNVI